MSIHRGALSIREFLLLAVASGLAGAGIARGADSTTQSLSRTNPAPAAVAAPAVAPAKAPWGRIVLVGASVSAGFTESEPFGGPKTRQYRLTRYFDAALRVPHEPVRSLADTLFFLQPVVKGRKQIEEAVKANPTLVAGIDFLFWFCYGDGPTDADRAQRFEQGLKLLEAVPCPLVVGDVPDASIAADTALSEEQIPSAAAIAAANRRLKEWAANRKQVSIVPLAGIMGSVSANKALTVHHYTVPGGKSRALLQSDKLHPSPAGCALLTLSTLDAFLARRPKLSAADVCWEPQEVVRAVGKRLEASEASGAKPQAAPAPN